MNKESISNNKTFSFFDMCCSSDSSNNKDINFQRYKTYN